MTILTVLRVPALKSAAWDLGAYSQAFYTTVHDDRFFYYTMDLPNNPSGSMFGAHFAPLLILLLPFVALAPAPPTLLFIQSMAVGSGGYAVFVLFRRHLLSERLSATFALAYLLDPLVIGVNWFDFHPEAFLVPFVLFACYFWEEQRWIGFVVFIGLTLSTLEVAGVLVAILGVFWALDIWVRYHNIRTMINRLDFRASICIAAVGLSWFWAGIRTVLLLNPTNALLSGGTDFWTVLGARSILEVPMRALTSPQSYLLALSVDWPYKVGFLFLLLGPVAFLPLFRPLSLGLLVPWLGVALASNNPSFYTLGNQYPSLVLPFVFYGAAMGLESLARRQKRVEYFAAIPPGPFFPSRSPSPADGRGCHHGNLGRCGPRG
jgi:uncharacterized membrane protein